MKSQKHYQRIQSMSKALFTEDLQKGKRDYISKFRYLLIKHEAFWFFYFLQPFHNEHVSTGYLSSTAQNLNLSAFSIFLPQLFKSETKPFPVLPAEQFWLPLLLGQSRCHILLFYPVPLIQTFHHVKILPP